MSQKRERAMETITMCYGGVPTGQVPTICFRLSDGGQTFLHSTGIEARPEDVERDQQLRNQLECHKLAMCKAYTLMQVKRMDMNSRIFETQVQRMMTEGTELFKRKTRTPGQVPVSLHTIYHTLPYSRQSLQLP